MSWLSETGRRVSKGRLTRKAANLADLHRRREEAQAQFWTPHWVAAGIWQALRSVTEREDKQPLSVLDSSVGSGRLFDAAPVERCAFYGVDIDEQCIASLAHETRNAQAVYEFQSGRLQDLRAKYFALAVINPPYGLRLTGPNMEPFACTTFGPFGPHTSALSHEYALEQALSAAQVVAAVMPYTADGFARQFKRLAAVYRLPRDTFAGEGANVETAVYIYGVRPAAGPAPEHRVSLGTDWPRAKVRLDAARRTHPVFQICGVDWSTPTITTPVTGDTTVRIDHHNRRIVLGFGCGLVESKVRNGLLESAVDRSYKHRYPRQIRSVGDGRLLLDTYLLADDPDAELASLLRDIAALGGAPQVSATFSGYWRKLLRRHARTMEPMRHWVRAPQTTTLVVEAKRTALLEPGNHKSPAIRRGQQLVAKPLGGEYELEFDGVVVRLRRDVMERLFTFINGSEVEHQKEWRLVHDGLISAFPGIAAHHRARINAMGIDQWLWPYQRDSLIELLIKPFGAAAGWEPGCGKARLAIALGLLSGKALLCVEPGLIPEMQRELTKLGVDPDLYQIIDRPEQSEALKSLNIISYHRLKSRAGSRKTLASRLRRRISTVIADEGSLLRNAGSQQTRAILQVSPQRLYVLDGTLIANYPRDLLPIAAASAGHGVAHQPYGMQEKPFMSRDLLLTANHCGRGIDVFRDRHVCLEWAVNEFIDDLRSGAKREVPKINNVVKFRRWAGLFVQRRLRDEPEVSPFVGCPKPLHRDVFVDWDAPHLSHYLKTALEFVDWYKNHVEDNRRLGRGSNLVAVLARIQAVIAAANNPHIPGKRALATYSPLTSKQRAVLESVARHVAAGRKTIVYMDSPSMVERLKHELQKGYKIESVAFHGQRSIAERTAELDERFRFGEIPVLLSTFCGQRGLNLGCAKAVLFYQRNWSGDVEKQSIDRTQRPDQDSHVHVERFHLRGSLDEYMKQLVDWKVAAADSGLDWGDGATADEVFLHMDAIIEGFCEATLGMSAREALDVVSAA